MKYTCRKTISRLIESICVVRYNRQCYCFELTLCLISYLWFQSRATEAGLVRKAKDSAKKLIKYLPVNSTLSQLRKLIFSNGAAKKF